MIARLKLTRDDGEVYLERWGFEWKRLGGVFVHRMSARDPGFDIHDHPWPFVSVILRGGYTERRASARNAWATVRIKRKPFRPFRLGLHEAHTIERLNGRTSWSLVVHGRNLRRWGFYVPVKTCSKDHRWVDSVDYDRLYPQRRGLHIDLESGLGVK